MPAGRYLVDYDSARNELLTITAQRSSNGGPFGASNIEAWSFGNAWRHTVPVKRPQTLPAAVAYDTVNKRHLGLFAGGAGNTTQWSYESTTGAWTQMFPTGFVPLIYATSEFDIGRRTSMTAASTTADAYLLHSGNFSIWDGTRWQAGPNPPSRGSGDGAKLTWDSKRNQVLLFSADFASAQTYSYSTVTKTWAPLGPALAPRYVNDTVSATYDIDCDCLRTFSYPDPPTAMPPETWSLNLSTSTWSRAAGGVVPATYINQATTMVYDPDKKQSVLLVQDGTPKAYRFIGNGWQLDSKLSGTVTLPDGYGFAAANDAANKRTLLVTGRGYRDTYPLDIWSFDGQTMNRLSGNAVGPTTQYQNVVGGFDSVRNVLVVTVTYPVFQTWEFELANNSWVQIQPVASPPAGSGFAPLIYVPSRNAMIAVAGDGQSWQYANSNWTAVGGTQPPARTSPSVVYDGARNAMLLWGGAGRNDLWELTATGWQDRTGASAPPSPSLHGGVMAYDPAVKRTLSMGRIYGDRVNDAWELSGNEWENTGPAPLPVPPFYLATSAPSQRGALFVPDQLFVNGATWYGAKIWTSSAYGPACSTNADCGGTLYCTDGVCCGASSCGTCETCNGTTPGLCTPLTNVEDTDSCSAASGKICNNKGKCSAALGTVCADGTACGSGFCVDGVCCESGCAGSCQACKASLKTSGTRDGICDVAKLELDNTCPRVEPPPTCDGDHTLVNSSGVPQKDCGGYRCNGTACRDRCASIADCVAPSVCNQAGQCAPAAPLSSGGSGCCATGPRSELPSIGGIAVLGVAAFSAALRRRRGAELANK
jgi:hypothetical protein